MNVEIEKNVYRLIEEAQLLGVTLEEPEHFINELLAIKSEQDLISLNSADFISLYIEYKANGGLADGSKEVVLYSVPRPKEHDALPSSFLGLPLFSSERVGQSLRDIDQAGFKKLIESLDLRFQDPQIGGETLCPIQDARVLRSILQKLLAKPETIFEERDEEGRIIADGETIVLDYFDIITDVKTDISKSDINKYWIQSDDIINDFRESLERISALRMSYKTPKGDVKFSTFFSYLKIEREDLVIKVKATKTLFNIFRDDRVLRLNRKLLNSSSVKLEGVLLLFISSLKHEYEPKSNQPIRIKNPISLDILVARAYPRLTPQEVISDSNKRNAVGKAMNSLRESCLIDFKSSYRAAGRRRVRIYEDVVSNCSLTTDGFKQLYRVQERDSGNGNTVQGYLSKYPMVTTRDEEKRKEYAKTHITRIYEMAVGLDGPDLKKMFAGVHSNTLKALVQRAELIEHQGIIELIARVREVRASRTKAA